MRKLIPFFSFFCLTGFTVTSGLPVLAAGCNSHINKNVEFKCAEDDKECQIEMNENSELNKTAWLL